MVTGVDNMRYQKETLLKIQNLEKMILQDFHRICAENNIEYFIMYGSGIGVERHKDIIPWDDDIDIAMLREDHDRVLSIIKKEYSDKYLVLNFEENNNFPITTTQLVLKGTKFRVKEFEGIDCDFGIYLDIFPLDYLSDNPKKARKQLNKAWFYNKLLMLRNMPSPKLPFKGVKGKIVKFACVMIHKILKIFRVNRKKIYYKYMEQAKKYTRTKRITFFGSTTPGTSTFEIRDILPTVEKPFGDFIVKVPCKNDKILRYLYGDYMILPPKEDRINHNPIELDFGKY